MSRLGRGFGVLAGIGVLASSMDAQAGGRDLTTAVAHCEVTGCGSNTPVLLGTPIEGLSLRGTKRNGVSLDPRLRRDPRSAHRSADCPSGAVLGVEGGRLVGKYGRNKCSGHALLGMTFGIIVEATTQQGPRRVKVTVRIDEESQVSTWELPRATAIPTYRLVWHDVSEATAVLGTKVTEGDSICPRREAWMESWQMPSKNTKIEIRNKWKEATDHLLIVQGETYRHDGSLDAAGSEWFNIACAGTSVAKMRLLGFDPMESAIYRARAERQATLKMLTGRYLAGVGEPSYTSPGMPLLWGHRDGRAFDGKPEPGRIRADVVEAYWGARGAVCVTHRRTWRKKESLSGGAGAIRDDADAIKVAMPEATELTDDERTAAVGSSYPSAESLSLRAVRPTIPPCPDGGRPPAATWYWVTSPVDHVIHAP